LMRMKNSLLKKDMILKVFLIDFRKQAQDIYWKPRFND